MVILFTNSNEWLKKPDFSDKFKKIIKRYEKLDMTCISCESLYMYVLSDFRLYDGSDLKTYLLMRW